MYNNTRTRYSRTPNGSRPSSGRSRRGGGNNGGGRARRGGESNINPDLFVNKAEAVAVAEVVESNARFTDFPLNSELLKRVAEHGYTKPTPIQEQTIPLTLSGGDVIGIANTGTGKTAAFLLPLLHKTMLDRRQKTLIIAPTRELAVQIEEELREFSRGLGIHSALCIGGAGFGNQIRALSRRPHFIIGTPGRLKDHLQRRTLRLNDATNLVLDEADRLVDMGFIDDVRVLVAELPQQRQSLFFSATILPEIQRLINTFMNNPRTVSVKSRDTAQNVDQDIVRYTDSFDRFNKLIELLAKPEFNKVLIFGRTKHGVEKLHESLQDHGFRSVSIHGNKNQSQRQRALREFKENHAQIMVATDVAARGLDIPLVSHVINYETPQTYADYIHRIGRTGRAENKGHALTFVH